MQDPLFSHSVLFTLPTLGTVFTRRLKSLLYRDNKPFALDLQNSLSIPSHLQVRVDFLLSICNPNGKQFCHIKLNKYIILSDTLDNGPNYLHRGVYVWCSKTNNPGDRNLT